MAAGGFSYTGKPRHSVDYGSEARFPRRGRPDSGVGRRQELCGEHLDRGTQGQDCWGVHRWADEKSAVSSPLLLKVEEAGWLSVQGLRYRKQDGWPVARLRGRKEEQRARLTYFLRGLAARGAWPRPTWWRWCSNSCAPASSREKTGSNDAADRFSWGLLKAMQMKHPSARPLGRALRPRNLEAATRPVPLAKMLLALRTGAFNIPMRPRPSVLARPFVRLRSGRGSARGLRLRCSR